MQTPAGRKRSISLRNTGGGGAGADVARAQHREVEAADTGPKTRGQITSTSKDMGRTLGFILSRMGNH